MSFAKWIGASLGWSFGGPIGAILGLALGSLIDKPSVKTKTYSRPNMRTQSGDFEVSFPSTKLAPNFMLKFLSIFDREAKGMLAMLDMNLSADNSKTMEVFNWKPIPFEKTLLETAVAVTKITSN